MKIGTKLYSILGLMSMLVLLVAAVGLYIASVSNEGLDTVYKDRVEPLEQLKVISDMYAVNIVDTAHKTRDGAVSWADARKSVGEAQKTIEAKWKTYIVVPEIL